MCGIFGFFGQSTDRSISKEMLFEMGKVIQYRGPDGTGIHYEPGVGLGNQRLAIIDPKEGHQPVFSDDRKVALVQNGEIFNYLELKTELEKRGQVFKTHSDTEVLLRAYLEYGIEFIHRLNGMFGIAIYDSRNETLHLIRDRLGVKPLYYANHRSITLFGSEIKCILAADFPRSVNPAAISNFLTYNYVPPPETSFEGIYHLLPGHRMYIKRNRPPEIVRWWRTDGHESTSRSIDSIKTEFMSILDDAVRIRMRSDVPFGAFLSGGIDSGTVVALMSKHSSQSIRTFTIGFKDPKYDESGFAESLAKRLNTDHTFEIVEPNMLGDWPKFIHHCDQPHGDVSFLPTFRVSKLAQKKVKMVLTGDGGDELFAGYEKYADYFSKQPPDVPFDFRRYFDSISLFSDESKKEILNPSSPLAKVRPSFESAKNAFNEARNYDPINQALYFDSLMLLPGNNLVKPDRMGMAASIEARTPFLDYRMVEFAFKIPGNLKLKNGTTKWIYKEAVRDLLGAEIVDRPKQMFTVPIGDWMRTELSHFVNDTLLQRRSLSRAYFSEKAMKDLLTAHMSGRMNYTRQLRALISLEIWLRSFIDRSSLSIPTGFNELNLKEPTTR